LAEWAPNTTWLGRRLRDLETARLVVRALREPAGRLTKARDVLAGALAGRRPAPRPQCTQVKPGLRVIPQLRAAHLEELDSVAPRRLLYFGPNYDMAGVLPPPHARRVTLLGACVEIL